MNTRIFLFYIFDPRLELWEHALCIANIIKFYNNKKLQIKILPFFVQNDPHYIKNPEELTQDLIEKLNLQHSGLINKDATYYIIPHHAVVKQASSLLAAAVNLIPPGAKRLVIQEDILPQPSIYEKVDIKNTHAFHLFCFSEITFIITLPYYINQYNGRQPYFDRLNAALQKVRTRAKMDDNDKIVKEYLFEYFNLSNLSLISSVETAITVLPTFRDVQYFDELPLVLNIPKIQLSNKKIKNIDLPQIFEDIPNENATTSQTKKLDDNDD
jgi:hypothetical protein